MAWISMLALVVIIMVALEGLGAERNFRRCLERSERWTPSLSPPAETFETLLPSPRHPAVTRSG